MKDDWNEGYIAALDEVFFTLEVMMMNDFWKLLWYIQTRRELAERLGLSPKAWEKYRL